MLLNAFLPRKVYQEKPKTLNETINPIKLLTTSVKGGLKTIPKLDKVKIKKNLTEKVQEQKYQII